MSNIVDFIVTADDNQILKPIFVNFAIKELEPEYLDKLLKLKVILESEFEPRFDEAQEALKEVVEGFKFAQSMIIEKLVVSETSEVGLDLDGKVTVKLEDEEFVIS